MDNTFYDDEKLYRAVFPPEKIDFFWKKDGSISSAALKDSKGLSVERGYYRGIECVVESMSEFFTGFIVSLTVGECRSVNASVIYKPTERSKFHSEIHGSSSQIVLSPHQRHYLARRAKVIGKLNS